MVDYDLACAGCGYALRGCRRDGPCPECGRAVADSFNVDRAKLLPSRCPSCGYGLARGATREGRCAECGWSPEPIEAFGLERLVRLRRGASLALAGSIALPVCLVLWPFAPLALSLYAGGWWLLAEPAAAGRSAGLAWGVRAASVFALLLGTAAILVLGAQFALGIALTSSATGDDALAGGIVLAASLAGGAQHTLAMLLAGGLGARLSEPGLRRRCWLTLLGGLAVLVTGVLLIGLGGVVAHVVLYPPLCLLLPVWVAGLAGWYLAQASVVLRLRGLVSAQPPGGASVRSGA